MIRYETRMVPRQSIHGPVSRDYVRIVVPAPDGFGIGFLPTRPGGPVERGIVFELRQILRRVVKETLPHAVAVWSLFVLQAAPQHAVDKLFVLRDLLFAWLTKLL